MAGRCAYAVVFFLLMASCAGVGPDPVAGENAVLLAKLVTAESELVISQSELNAIGAAGGVEVTEAAGAGGARTLTFSPPLPAVLVGIRDIQPFPVGTLVAMGPLAQTADLLDAATPLLIALPGDATGILAMLFLRDADVRLALDGTQDEVVIRVEGEPRIRVRGILPDCDSEETSAIEVQRLSGDVWITEAELFCDLLGMRGF